MSIRGPAATTATIRPMRAASSWRCRTPPGRAEPTLTSASVRREKRRRGRYRHRPLPRALYAEINDKILRYTLPTGSIVPNGPSVPIVTGLPLGGDHPMHPFAIDRDGSLYIDVATATNACQSQNRIPKSSASTHAPSSRRAAASGAMTRTRPTRRSRRRSVRDRDTQRRRVRDRCDDHIFVTQHGRDQLHANWPELYKPEEEATLPAEELLLLKQGGTTVGRSATTTVISANWCSRRVRRRWGQEHRAVRDQESPYRGVSGALGAQWHGALRQAAVSEPLS